MGGEQCDMSNLVIGNYDPAVSIDGSTHYILIQPGGASTAYNRINRNTLLGVAGQPMDISTSQSVSNKTLGNTNTLTIKDTLFTLQDDADTTKQAKFQLSGITTATTRTYTLPNASSTLADIATAQTLTNKTLTAPVINNGSITGTTITTDAIVGQSSATNGTVYGMSIASGKVGTNSIADSAITGVKVSSYKIVRQDNTTDSTETAARILTGWGVGIPGANASITETVTFGGAFTQKPIVIVTYGGDNTSGATTYGSGSAARKSAIATATSITTTTFTAIVATRDGTNWTAGDSVFYQWTAIGN
jgi:hypothetical protein